MGLRWQRTIALLLVLWALFLGGCGHDRLTPITLLEGTEATPAVHPIVGAIAEVSPPERIQQLKPYLDVYQPQVRIITPRENETLQTTEVSVTLQVRDMPLFKEPTLGLGPHLHLFLDDQPYQAVYDTETPLILRDLAPGTHTLRVFATRPWGESFKNEGAYDQVSFNVFTASASNLPDSGQALLTFNEPQGQYGAEPILLDFYLKNAPLHVVAEDLATVPNWRIRCTVNGESFVFDRWQPIYLKGFQPGQNWVKLELIDETGKLIDNAYNTAIRVIEYHPDGSDVLAQLMRGDLPLSKVRGIVDPTYVAPSPAPSPVTVPPLESGDSASSVTPEGEQLSNSPGAPSSEGEANASASEPIAVPAMPEPTPPNPPAEPTMSAPSLVPQEQAPVTSDAFKVPVKLPQGLLPNPESKDSQVLNAVPTPETPIAPPRIDTTPPPQAGARSPFPRDPKAPAPPVMPTPEAPPLDQENAPSIPKRLEEGLDRLEERIESIELPDLPALPEVIAPPPLPNRIREDAANTPGLPLPDHIREEGKPSLQLEPNLDEPTLEDRIQVEDRIQEGQKEQPAPASPSAGQTAGDRSPSLPSRKPTEPDPETPMETLEAESELI